MSLSPERADFARATKIGAVNYRHWLGLTQSSRDSTKNEVQIKPAPVVQVYNDRYWKMGKDEDNSQQPRVWAFGYVMGQAKAIVWIEGQMPILVLPEEHRQVFQEIVEFLISGAGLAAWAVGNAIKNAWYAERDDRRKKSLPDVEARFWADTEPHFYDTAMSKLKSLVENGQVGFESPAERELKLKWLRVLRRACLAIFDDLAQVGQIGQADPKRIARARNQLRHMLSAKNKKMMNALQLGPDDPESSGG